MPQQESGRLRGFQLWINLPAAEKMVEPNYREYSPEQIPTVELGNNSHAKVISGTFLAHKEKIAGPVKNVSTQPDYFDITLAAGETLNLPIDNQKRVLLYVNKEEFQ